MEQKTELQTALAEIKSTIIGVADQQRKMQSQVDAIDLRGRDFIANGTVAPALVETLKAHEGFQRLLHDRRGTAILSLSGKDAEHLLQRKTTLLATAQGFAVGGVLPSDRDSGIVAEARQTLTIRDALSSRPTEMGVIDFVRVTSPMINASPVAEGTVKPENAVSFASASEKIKTIATWIPASRQILDDFAELASFLQSSLSYYVDREEEQQLLSGDNTGENLHGLTMQASPFNSGLLVGGSWTKIDVIGRAIEQLIVAKEVEPSFVVLHPSDWWSIRLLKDGLGRFLVGSPQTSATATLFDLKIISTTSISPNTFLIGSGQSAAAEIRDRMSLQYEISTEHASFFTSNLVACRAERRLALVVKRPASFVTGNFSSSPA